MISSKFIKVGSSLEETKIVLLEIVSMHWLYVIM